MACAGPGCHPGVPCPPPPSPSCLAGGYRGPPHPPPSPRTRPGCPPIPPGALPGPTHRNTLRGHQAPDSAQGRPPGRAIFAASPLGSAGAERSYRDTCGFGAPAAPALSCSASAGPQRRRAASEDGGARRGAGERVRGSRGGRVFRVAADNDPMGLQLSGGCVHSRSLAETLPTDPSPGPHALPGLATASVPNASSFCPLPPQLSQKVGRKKRRLAEGRTELQERPLAEALHSPGPQRSIYFMNPKDSPARLGTEFFNQPAVPLARAFLGQVLVRRLADGTELRGRIVETEAYVGPEDEAAHSRGGRQTPRNRGMFMRPGTLYVYIIYGMYCCMNVSSRGDGACVLLRALEPLGGLDAMRQLRCALRKGTTGRTLKDRELCSGPSKLCQALAIDKSFDQRDLAQDEALWLERSTPGPGVPTVVAATRVGIGQAGEWAQKPLRFYIQGSPWVSVVDRMAEQRACSHE
ncbi:DNA-3-methyladenine glycosylase [Ochotona princeps]|uniref:DNA-3-methyladenine glycosylase n=1 Tax=Ochotona princeps TaxID=9978 RepID=UPI0027150A86|nr:DNA-3-methyladenine glycosylase [Ochotona princeps]